MEPIPVIDLDSYILSHHELTKQPIREENNAGSFREDYRLGILKRHLGRNVAYLDGVMCGAGQFKITLFNRASSYYDEKGLSVFEVPENSNDLERCVTESMVND